MKETVLNIEVMSGINADGFTAIITDRISGEKIFKQEYLYGYTASYDRRWASSRAPYVTDIINDLKSQYNVSDIEVTSGMNIFKGERMPSASVEKFKRNYLSEDVSGEVEYLDDYEESIVEDTQMTDAQRLSLQELDSCLEYGEISQEEHDAGQHIQWDINAEDVVLFIAGMGTLGVSLSDIEHVEYGDCDESEFDGCYSVTMSNGSVKKYGWHDMDMTGSLTRIEETVDADGQLFDESFNSSNVLKESTSVSTWEELSQYKHCFHVSPKYSPNSTYSDDVLRLANECSCIKVTYQKYPSFNNITVYLCKTPSDYDEFVNRLNNSKILKDYAVVYKLREFDISAVEEDMRRRLQYSIDKLSASSRNGKLTKQARERLMKDCPSVYVDNYVGGVRIKFPCDGMLEEDTTNFARRPPFYINNEDYSRVDAKDFVKHPMNYNVTSELKFEVKDGVKVYLHRGPGKQREFYVIIDDTYVQHAFNNIETVEKYLRKNNLVKEVISESFKPGDVVYVTVCKRQGRVRRMISPYVVEVELHENGVYPEIIDRYYVDEVKLQYSDDQDDEF